METYNIVGMNPFGETKFLSKLFTQWVDEEDRKQALELPKNQVDNLLPLLRSENIDFVTVGYFPTRLQWETQNNEFVNYN